MDITEAFPLSKAASPVETMVALASQPEATPSEIARAPASVDMQAGAAKIALPKFGTQVIDLIDRLMLSVAEGSRVLVPGALELGSESCEARPSAAMFAVRVLFFTVRLNEVARPAK